MIRNRIIFFCCSLICALDIFAQELEFGTGLLEDEQLYNSLPRVAQRLTRDFEYLPKCHSLMQFSPFPKSQGIYGTCSSWATAYAARTIAEAVSQGWTDREKITREAFSPIFVYTLIKYAGDDACTQGAFIEKAAKILKEKGVAKFSDFDKGCADYVPSNMFAEAEKYKIDDYQTLFSYGSTASYDEKIRNVKKAISENQPVIVSMVIWPSYKTWQPMDVWNGVMQGDMGHHAMCLIGYDDEKYGGAFQIMNSWGTLWANKGFIWVKYEDFYKNAKGAISIYVKKKESPKPIPVVKKNVFSGEMFIQLKDGKKRIPLHLINESNLAYYKAVGEYLSGTQYRLYVSNNEPAWVYVISSDLQNNVSILFPYSNNVSAALNYKSNNIAIPEESSDVIFGMDENSGVDYFCVLYSQEELDINGTVNSIKNAQGTFYQKVKTVLGGKLAPQDDIRYVINNMGFSARTNGTVVPLIVELSHKGINARYE